MAENKVLKKCKCGCGKLTNYGSVWIRGHNARNMSEKTKRKMSLARQNISEETRNKLSKAGMRNINAKGSKRSEEHKRKISKVGKGRIFTEETRKKIGLKHIGKVVSKESRKKMSDAHKGKKLSKETKLKIKLSSIGKKRSEEHKRKISIANSGKKRSEEHKRKLSVSHIGIIPSEKTKIKLSKTGIKKWQDPIFQKKQYKARAIRPNKPETILLNLLNDLFLNEYKYVGDFQFFLGGRNPDFMNINGQKKLIELYGDYWHKNDNPQDRIDHFKQYGFDTLVIWECELKRNKLKLKNKLMDFHRI